MLYQVVVGKGNLEKIYYVEGEDQAVVFDFIWKKYKPGSSLEKIIIACLKQNVEQATEDEHI